MPDDELKKPVIIIGNSRSGTTMLAKTLGLAPGMTLWFEPISLWRVGTAYQNNDRALAKDAKPWVKRHIRRKFLAYQRAHEDRRVLEKTPNNVIRIPFIREVFPEAKLIFIIRDGRGTFRSTLENYNVVKAHTLTPKALKHRWSRLALIPWWEWPSYLPGEIRGSIRTYFTKKPLRWYGMRYPGGEEEIKQLTLTQRVAKQWAKGAEIATADLEDVPEDVCMRVRYEDVVSDPRMWYKRMLKHCEIPVEEEFLQHIEDTVFSSSVNRWQTELSAEVLAEAMPIMEPQLKKLGYI